MKEREEIHEEKENTLNGTLACGLTTIDHAQVKDFTLWTIEETVNWG